MGACSKSDEEIELKFTTERDGLVYKIDDDTPFTGIIYELNKWKTRQSEQSYKNGKLNGFSKILFTGTSEAVFSEINYKDGEYHGAFTQYYPLGQKSLEGNHINGKPSGLWTQWNNFGKIILKGHWKDGIRVGTWQIWNDNLQALQTVQY